MQGSLQILWDPNAQSTFVYPDDPTNRLSNVVIDLKGTSRTFLRVDYAQYEPVLAKELVLPDTVGLAVNGHLVFKMLVPLTAPRVAGYSVDVIIMARPSQDMRFGIPSVITPTLEYQSGEVEADDGVEEHIVVLAQGKEYPTSEAIWGEECLSVRALVQKVDPVVGVSNSAWANSSHAIPAYMYGPRKWDAVASWTYDTGVTGRTPFTNAGFFSCGFVGVRGGQRVKYFGTEGGSQIYCWPLQAGTHSVLSFVESYRPTTSFFDFQSAYRENGGEWLIPSYLRQKYWTTRYWRSPAAVPPIEGARFNSISGITAADQNFGLIYAGAGPDFTPVRFRRIPALINIV
jgi:hypothetical protein